MELLFLGTGSGVPSKHRNVSSLALKLLDEINSVWLFDCGEATQHQILKTTLKPRKINKIFITHMHGDHIFGLPGFLSSRSFQGGKDQVTIYGPKGIKGYVLSSLKYSGSFVQYPLKFIEFEDKGLLMEEGPFKVYVDRLQHGVPSYGFRIEEEDHEGTLDAEKLKELNISPGPIYARIKNKETVTLDDGRVIDGSEFVGPNQKGRIITILGDTVKHPNSLSLAKEADVLVHEATFAPGDEGMARQYNHSTSIQAAQIAKEAGVKTLLLNHFSSRYMYRDIQKIIRETRKVFPNTLAMSDFGEYEIPLKKADESR